MPDKTISNVHMPNSAGADLTTDDTFVDWLTMSRMGGNIERVKCREVVEGYRVGINLHS